MNRKRSSGSKKSKKKLAKLADKHLLYEASVQSAEAYIELLSKIYKKKRKRKIRSIREDFCGTARLCYEWVLADKKIECWGVDLDQDVLDWGVANHAPFADKAASRVNLICGDVRNSETPQVDALIAFNFSYYCFKERSELLNYFKVTHDNLNDEGVLFLDLMAGPKSYDDDYEEREVNHERNFYGDPIPPFTYVWEQDKFNQLTHEMTCYIHFEFPDGSKMKKAFTYEWRIWTPPELVDLLKEAGYSKVDFYLQGWDDDLDETDDNFIPRTKYNELDTWFGYLVATK